MDSYDNDDTHCRICLERPIMGKTDWLRKCPSTVPGAAPHLICSTCIPKLERQQGGTITQCPTCKRPMTLRSMVRHDIGEYINRCEVKTCPNSPCTYQSYDPSMSGHTCPFRPSPCPIRPCKDHAVTDLRSHLLHCHAMSFLPSQHLNSNNIVEWTSLNAGTYTPAYTLVCQGNEVEFLVEKIRIRKSLRISIYDLKWGHVSKFNVKVTIPPRDLGCREAGSISLQMHTVSRDYTEGHQGDNTNRTYDETPWEGTSKYKVSPCQMELLMYPGAADRLNWNRITLRLELINAPTCIDIVPGPPKRSKEHNPPSKIIVVIDKKWSNDDTVFDKVEMDLNCLLECGGGPIQDWASTNIPQNLQLYRVINTEDTTYIDHAELTIHNYYYMLKGGEQRLIDVPINHLPWRWENMTYTQGGSLVVLRKES